MRYKNYNKQKGAVTLIIALLLLIGISLLTIFTTKVVMTDQKVTANIVREKQAFESAEAGRQFIIGCVGRVGGLDSLATCPDLTFIDTDLDGAVDIADAVTGNVADVINFTVPADFQGNSPAITLAFVDSVAEPYRIRVQSIGSSDDNTANRAVIEDRIVIPPIGGPPSHPLISKGSVAGTGTGDIINTETNATIWSGGVVDFSGNGQTFISDGEHVVNPTKPQCLADKDAGNTQLISEGGQGGGPDTIGIDILDSDPYMAAVTDDEFFDNFFNATPATIQNAASYDTAADLDGMTSSIMWIEGDATINGGIAGCSLDYGNNEDCADVGGTVEPVIIVVNGDLNFVGNVDIYGILYITGDIHVAGTTNVYGSTILEGVTSGAGTFNLTYCSAFNSPGGFNPITYPVPNTWRDW